VLGGYLPGKKPSGGESRERQEVGADPGLVVLEAERGDAHETQAELLDLDVLDAVGLEVRLSLDPLM
jgi:hypothetical protein